MTIETLPLPFSISTEPFEPVVEEVLVVSCRVDVLGSAAAGVVLVGPADLDHVAGSVRVPHGDLGYSAARDTR